jgi:hypothetical protein
MFKKELTNKGIGRLVETFSGRYPVETTALMSYRCGAARTVEATKVSLLKKNLFLFNKLLGY